MSEDFFTKKQSIAAIIRISFNAFKKNIKYVALSGLFFIVPLNLILLLIPMPSFVEVQDYLLNQAMNLSLTSSPEFTKLIGYMYTIFGIAVIFGPLSAGVAAYLAKTYIHSEVPSFQGFLDSSIVKWGKHSVTSLLYNLILGLFIMVASFFLVSGFGAFIGFILVIPAVTYGVGFSFYSIIVATSDKWSLKALKESHRIVRPILMPTIGFKLTTSFLSYIFTVVFSIAIELLLSLMTAILPGAFYVLSFICGVAGDTLRLFFLILPAVWFMNRESELNMRT